MVFVEMLFNKRRWRGELQKCFLLYTPYAMAQGLLQSLMTNYLNLATLKCCVSWIANTTRSIIGGVFALIALCTLRVCQRRITIVYILLIMHSSHPLRVLLISLGKGLFLDVQSLRGAADHYRLTFTLVRFCRPRRVLYATARFCYIAYLNCADTL